MVEIGVLKAMEISWLSATIVAALAAAFLLILTVLYRLYLHPLAAYPGPPFAKCTSWYSAYQSYTGNIHLDILRCHELYGDVVRYRPNGLLFNNVEGLQGIYLNPTRTKKSRGYFSFRKDGTVSILNAIDKEEHAPRRRLLSRAFSIAALQKYEPLIFRTAKVFCDSILEHPGDNGKEGRVGPPLNIGDLSSYFTFDVMSYVIFYSPQNLITETHGRSIVKGIDSVMFFNGVALQQPSILDFPILRKLFLRVQHKEAVAFGNKSKEFAIARVALEKERHIDDIFGGLIGQGDGKGSQGLSIGELAADATVMMIAGTDTSSVAISAFFFYLSRHPDAYAKLASEIRTTFASADEICQGLKLASCAYLRACIDESLRLAPPVAAPLWREMKQQDVVAGVVLPKAADVATCIYSIQRNPAYFVDPNEFKPERWLHESQNDSRAELAKKAFVPFSLGARGCIGKNLAYMELSILLAQIMYRTDFKAAGGALGKVGETLVGDKGVVNFELKGHFTCGKTGPFIHFIPRELGNTSAI